MKIEFDNYRQRCVLREALMNYLLIRMRGLDPSVLCEEGQLEFVAEYYVNFRYSNHSDEFKRVKVLEKIEDFKAFLEIKEAI